MSSSNDAFRSVATSDLIFGSHAAVYALDRLVQEHETVDERSAAQGLATAARILFDALADRLIERDSLNDDNDDDNDNNDNDDDNDDNDENDDNDDNDENDDNDDNDDDDDNDDNDDNDDDDDDND